MQTRPVKNSNPKTFQGDTVKTLTDLINWLGEATWGNIPYTMHPFFLVGLVVLFVFLTFFIRKWLPKTKPENVRDGMALTSNGYEGIPREEIAHTNRKIVNFLICVLLLLLSFLLLPFVGASIDETPQPVPEEKVAIAIHEGEKVAANWNGVEILYTCTKTATDAVFTYQQNTYTRVMKKDDEPIFKLLSSEETVRHTWWGKVSSIKQVRQPYRCEK